MWRDSFVAVRILLWFAVSIAVGAQDYVGDQEYPAADVDLGNTESVQASKATLIFNSDSVTVDPGNRLQLDCGVQGKYRNCFWEKPGDDTKTFQVEDVHAQYLDGLSKPDNVKGNECGIVINSVGADDHGEWVCKVFVLANTLQGVKKVIVTVRPQQPSLNINENPLVVAEKETKEVSCTVAAARPPARIRWLVGTEDVTIRSKTENIPISEQGTYRSVSILTYQFQHRDDGKTLMCRIEHPTLQEPEYAEVPLDVRYGPYAISPGKIYSIPMENEYEIKYNLTSNPVPQMSWFVNDIEIPVPGESGRYKTSSRELLDNMYMATLKIRQFTAEDLALTYRLTAKNDLGDKNFDITLSAGPAPPDGASEVSSGDEIVAPPDQLPSEDTVGSGTIAAIIVIVVFIFILLFIIGVMRYRQMYCFGPKDKIKNHLKESGENLKEEHDTESSHNPNATKGGKASNLFKNFTARIKPKRTQKEPRLDKVEEGETNEEMRDGQDESEGSVCQAVVD